MAVTSIATIKMFAREANKKYFNGELNFRGVEWKISKKMFRTLGQFGFNYTTKHQTVKMSERVLNAGTKEWHTTLVHELVHMWQFQTGRRVDHGYSFKSKAAAIAQINPQIVITRTRTSEAIDKAATTYEQKKRSFTQYMMVRKSDKGSMFNIVKNLNLFQIIRATNEGWTVFVNTGDSMTCIQHKKTFERALHPSSFYFLRQIENHPQYVIDNWKQAGVASEKNKTAASTENLEFVAKKI